MSAPAKQAGLAIGVDNQQIADVFEEIAELLALQDANPFRVRAYRNAARTLRGEERPLGERVAAGQALPKLPGIGHDLTEKITEMARSGECQLLNRLRREVPPGLGELLQLPGIGPKRAHQLYHELGVDSLAALREAQAGPRLDYLEQLRGVERALIAGSYRRRRDTVGDLDVQLQGDAQGGQVMAAVLRFPAIAEVFASGSTRASLGLRGGMQVDVRIVAADSFGAALQYFTGSKAHGIALRRWAQAQGCKLNEYGLFRDGNKLAGRSETDIYQALGLPLIPPKLREDTGERNSTRNRSASISTNAAAGWPRIRAYS